MVCLPLSARAAELEITITNQMPAGGFAFSPVWLGFHDGTFDTFNAGAAASGEVEAVAELANTAPITAAFAGTGPQTSLAPGGPYTPGASAQAAINIPAPATTRYLSYLSMVVPSNDFFFGNDSPLAVEVFDAGGNFTGPITISIFGADVWDAGTEVNDVTNGPAFLAGQTATDGTAEGGTVNLFLTQPGAADYLNDILGLETAPGYNISELITSGGLIATIEIQEVPEPGTLALVAIGGVALAALGRRRLRRRLA